MSENVYVNIKENHFKVWGYDCFSQKSGESEVVFYWGRIGFPLQRLQSIRKTFGDVWDARDFIISKVDEKIRKGYNSIPNWQYFGAINDGKPISQLVRLIDGYQRAQDKKRKGG